jgi:hypothetical protein
MPVAEAYAMVFLAESGFAQQTDVARAFRPIGAHRTAVPRAVCAGRHGGARSRGGLAWRSTTYLRATSAQHRDAEGPGDEQPGDRAPAGVSENAIRKLVGPSKPAAAAQLAFAEIMTVATGKPPAAGVPSARSNDADRVAPEDPTRTIPNPERRALDKEIRAARTDLAKLEREYGAAAADNAEQHRPRDSRDAGHAVIAADLVTFRLAGFAWTPAHENHQPDFPQRRESLSTAFSAALMRHHMSPCPPRRDIHQTRTHSALVSSRRVFAAGSLGLPCPSPQWLRLPRPSDRHFGD